MNAERKAALQRRLTLQSEGSIKPAVTIARGCLIEVDIANSVEVLQKNLPVLILETDMLLTRIELPGNHRYTFPTRMVEAGQVGMMRFHEPGKPK